VAAARTSGRGGLTAVAVAVALAGGGSAAGAQEDDGSPYAPVDRPGPALSVPAGELAASLDCPRPVAAGSEPVLLVHGTNLDPEANFSWNYVPAFEADGRSFCTVALPRAGMEDIQVAAEHVVHAVRSVAAAAGGPVDVVGYSQGGMIGRWALRFWPDTRTLVDDLVGLAPSNHGTETARPACAQECAPAYQQQRSTRRSSRR
jgi:pimeloyl-ACP methyl ester carboxylesterase